MLRRNNTEKILEFSFFEAHHLTISVFIQSVFNVEMSWILKLFNDMKNTETFTFHIIALRYVDS